MFVSFAFSYVGVPRDMKNDFWVLYKKIHYTCNVSLRRVRITAVTAENQYYVFCVHVLVRARVFGWGREGGLRCPACSAPAPYLWPVRLCNISALYPINGRA